MKSEIGRRNSSELFSLQPSAFGNESALSNLPSAIHVSIFRTSMTSPAIAAAATIAGLMSSVRPVGLPWRPLKAAAHGVLGWLLFPLRYLDLLLFRNPRAGQIGNHAYVWLKKPLRTENHP